MPDPPAQLNITYHQVPDETRAQSKQILSDAGFHIGFEEGDYLNIRPFELTGENEAIVEDTIAELRVELEDTEISDSEGPNRDAGNLVEYEYNITIEGEMDVASDRDSDSGTKRTLDEALTSSSGELDNDMSWQRTDDDKSRVRGPGEDTLDKETHTIHSFGDITHEISYELDEQADELAFDSMEPADIDGGSSLDAALAVEHVHCTCGKQNMTRGEAIEHLEEHR